MRVALIAWNKFQIQHYKALLTAFDDVTLVIERRHANNELFSSEDLSAIEAEVNTIYVDKSKIKHLDGMYDVIFCQTVFPQIEHITRSKIAMLQYGLAKENHNYGTWRGFADIIFSYGSYSTQKLSHFAPTVNVGHPSFPRLEQSEKEELLNSLGIEPLKKTITYCPTWGDLSSYGTFIDEITSLSDQYNVILKLHHNTLTLEGQMEFPSSTIIGNEFNLSHLIQISDVIISDYSGAIFDGIYDDKPVILCQHLELEDLNHDKVGLDSIEFARTDELGTVVTNPKLIQQTINDITFVPRAIKSELFHTTDNTKFKDDIRVNLEKLIGGEITKSQGQRFVTELVRKERIQKFTINRLTK